MKAWLLYFISLLLLGRAVRMLMEDERLAGWTDGFDTGYITGKYVTKTNVHGDA